MPRENVRKKDIDFLKLFKKSLALSFTALIFGVNTSYATQIDVAPGYGANVSTQDGVTNITGGQLNGDTAFIRYINFLLSQGDIANLIFSEGANRYVNLVDNQVRIDGIFNAMKNGNVGGDVIFVSPLGFIVGSSGIVNVGSLQTITPTQAAYDSLIGMPVRNLNYNTHIANLSSDGDSYGTEIQGKIFSAGNVDIADGTSVTVGDAAKIISGFNQNGFSSLKNNGYDFSKVVNNSGVVSADYLTNSDGNIKISTKGNIYSDGTNGLIQSTGDVVFNGEEVTIGSKIYTSGGVDISNSDKLDINNDITANGSVNLYATSSINQKEGTNLTADLLRAASEEIIIDGNITTKNGINLNEGNRGQSFVQGLNSEIVNTNSGNIDIKVKNITANKIRNDAQNGGINFKEVDSLLLQNTVKTTNEGSISIDGNGTVAQSDDSVLAFDSAKDLSFKSKSVGTETQSINVKVAGNVSVTGNRNGSAYLRGKDSDLNVSRVSNVQDIVLQGDKAIYLNDRVVALNSIDITAKEGVVQSAVSQLVNNGAGGITITNTDKGDISIGNVSISQGLLGINNSASDGAVNVNGSIDATNTAYIDIYSAGGYNQSGTITSNGVNASGDSVNIVVGGDASVGKITGSQGVKISAGSILLNNLLKSNNSKISLTATTGGIQQSGVDKTIDSATTVDMGAVGNIGSESQNIVVSAGSSIGATSSAGGVSLVGDNSVINLSDISSATDLRITVTGDNGDIVFDGPLSDIAGDVLFSTNNDLNITSGINADGSITLSSINGDIILGALLDAGKDVNLTANGSILQSGSYDDVTIKTGRDVNLTALGGDVGALGSAIQLASFGGVSIVGDKVYLQSPTSIKIVNISNKDGVASSVVDILTTNQNDGNIDLAGLIKGSTVKLDAKQGITQSVAGKTIDAGDLSLFARGTSIGETGKGISFSADAVSADATKSVVLVGEDTDISTSTIKATENIDLSTKIVDATKGKGKITIADTLETTSGYIKLDSAKNLDINNNISAGKSVQISAVGGINQSESATITSGTAGGELGSGDITIANSGSGIVNLYDITANQGKLTVINNANANIVLNSVLHSVNSDVVLNSTGNIVHNHASDASVIAGGNAILNAVNVGTDTTNLIVDASGALYSTADNLYVTNSSGDLVLGVLNIGESATITSNGDILQDGQNRDSIISDGVVNLIAVNGSVGSGVDGLDIKITGDNGRLNVTANDINLSGTSVATGVLNAGGNINIDTTTTNGSVVLKDNIGANGNITIVSGNGIEQSAGTILRGSDTSGSIEISTTKGDISLLEVTNNNGSISIDSAGNATLNAIVSSTGGTITIDAGGNVTQTFDGVSISTDKDVILTSGDNIGSNSKDLFVSSSDGTVSAISTAGSLYLTGVNTDLASSRISATKGNIDLTTTGTGNIIIDSVMNTTNGSITLTTDNALNIANTITASNNISIDAKGGAITQSNGLAKALDAQTGSITLKTNGDIGSSDNSLALNAGQNVSADGSNVYLASPNKTINISQINSTGVVSVETTTSGDINLNGKVSGTDISLESAGAISQAAGNLIDAIGALDLTAHGGSIGSQANAISFKAASVSANASDSVALKGENVDIDVDNISAGNSIDLTTVGSGKITLTRSLNAINGYINLDAAGGLELGDYSLTAKDYIKLATDSGDIYYNALLNATDGSITIDSAGKISQGNNGSLNATGDIDLKAGLTIGESGNAIKLGSNGKVKASGSDVYLTSTKDLNLGKIVANNGDTRVVDISTTTGNISITDTITGNTVTLDAQGNITQTPDTQTITATNGLKLVSQTGDIGTDKAIKFKAGSVEANASNGSVKLAGVETNINTSNITAKNNIDISTITSGDIIVDDAISTAGRVTLTAADALNINETITSTGADITLNSGANLVISNEILASTDVVINSSGGISQNAGSITTQTGDVIIANNSDDLVSLTSVLAGNNVTVTSLGELNLSNITSSGSIAVSNAGVESSNIRLNNLLANNGSINVTNSSGGDIVLETLVEATNNNILLDATAGTTSGNIVQTTDGTKMKAVNTTLKGNQVGSNANAIDMSLSGTVTANATDVYIKNSQGSLKIDNVTAGNTANIEVAGNLTQLNNGTTAITAGGDVVLRGSGASVIGESKENTLGINTNGTLSILETESAYISSNQSLNLGRVNGVTDVYFKTINDGSNIVLTNLVNASNIELDASGSILQNSILDKTIDAGKLVLNAGGDIGEKDNAIDFTATNSLSADAWQGSVVLNSVGKDIDTDWINAGKSIDLTTTGSGKIKVSKDLQARNGYISLVAADGLELDNHLIDASQDVTLKTESGDIILNANVIAGEDITIDSAGNIIQNDGFLGAGGNIDLDAVGTIGESVANAINLQANGDVSAKGSSVYLTSSRNLYLAAIEATDVVSGVVNVNTTAGDINILDTIKGNTVTIDANGSIVQTPDIQTITATNGLKLVSQTGNIGTDNAITFKAGSVEANATNGSVKLAGVETDINTSNITAKNDIDITTITSGDINVDRSISTGGNVMLDSAGKLTVSETITSTGSNVNLIADNGISLGAIVNAVNGVVTVDADSSNIVQTIDGKVIEANIVDLIANNIGTDSKYINVSAIDRVNADGVNIYIASDDAVFNIGAINANDKYTNESVNIRSNVGDVNLKDLVKGNHVNISAEKNITQDSALTKSVDATTLTLTARDKDGNLGNIGDSNNSLDIKVSDRVNVNNAKDVYINGVESTLNTGDITATNATITSDKGLNLKGLIKAAFAKLSAKDSITQDSTLVGSKSIEASDIDLTSENGNIGETGNAIDFKTDTLKATARNGSVVLNGVESDISTDSIVAGQNIDLSTEISGNITISKDITTNGYIRLDSAGGLNVGESLTGSSVELISQNGDVVLSELVTSTNGDITIDANGNITQDVNKKVLDSAQGINLTSNDLVGTDSQSLVVKAVDDITLNASNVYLTGDNSTLRISSINANRQDKTLGALELSTINSGSILIGDTVNANNIILNSVDTIVANKAMNAQNSMELAAGHVISVTDVSGNVVSMTAGDEIGAIGDITAQNGITMTADELYHTTSGKVIKSENGNVNITATKGNIDLDVDVINTNGSVSITNNSSNGNTNLKGVNAGSSYNITNNANGTLNIQGSLSSNSDSTIVSNNTGNNSGINISSDSVINNKNGSLTISNSGAKGLTFAGKLKNNHKDGTSVYIKNEAGSIKLTGDIDNGLSRGATNLVSIQNNGVDADGNGLVFSDGVINNHGSLILENSNGSMTLAGQINAEVASTNTFKNSSDNDFYINSIVKNIGNTVTFENNGSGSLILDDGARLTLGDSDGYVGVLNINNSSYAVNSALIVNGDIISADGGFLNLMNTGKAGIDVNETSSINVGDITIINNNGDVDITTGATIKAYNNLTVDNYASGANLNIDGQLNAKNIVINSNDSNINIAHNNINGNIVATNDVSINATNSNVVNSSTQAPIPNTVGISAGNKLSINAKNVGKMDATLSDIINNGFDLDVNNAVNVKAENINVTASQTANLRAQNDLNIENLSAASALLTAVNGDINAQNVDVANLYLYAMADDGQINVTDLKTSSLTGEAGGNISVNSSDDLYVDSLLSRNDSIKIDSQSNTEIREIAAPKDITVNVNDEKLTIYNLGRVIRAQDIIPETVNLLVNDAKNVSDNKNGKLDIYNAYVQDKVTMKADTITAQVYDISDSSVKGDKRVDKFGNVATGFHNANKNGELLDFDVQGANTPQEDVGSTPHNPYYEPDENDKRASSVHLTIGDSVGGAEYGANFEKLYADYAFVDSINNSNPSAVSKIDVQSGIIGKYGILRNNNQRLDIANSPLEEFAINKHYDDAPDKGITNKTSFNSSMFEDITIIDPNEGVNELIKSYNPHRLVENPDLDKKLASGSAKGLDNSVVKAGASTGLRNINWVVRDKNNTIVGASNAKEPFEITSIIEVSTIGIKVLTNTSNSKQLKKGDKLHIDMKYRNVGFNVDGKVQSVDEEKVDIIFTNADKITKNILMFVGMCQENL